MQGSATVDCVTKAWKDYLDLLRPLEDDPDAYERMEPWAWANLQIILGAQQAIDD